MTVLSILDELLIRISAYTLTVTLFSTLGWPFAPDGWWDVFLKYMYMGTGVVILYIFAPIIYYTCQAAYLDLKAERERKLNEHEKV